ncbi:MAG: MFS transporter, partial [Coxiella sp. (in: Bacteria)]
LSFTLVKENNLSFNRGTAIAINNMAVVISGAIFQPLIGKLLEVFSVKHTPLLSYRYAFSVLIVVYLVAFIIARFFILNKGWCKVEMAQSIIAK